MPISSLDNLIASAKQRVRLLKTVTRTTVATGWFTLFDVAGEPGAGVLAGTSTTAGVVPEDTTVGAPLVAAFGVGAQGYLTNVDFANSVASRLMVFDMLWKAGAYSFAAGSTTVTAPPSFAARVPAGNYTDTELWFEVSTAFATGTSWSVQVSYTNQNGTAGRSSVVANYAAAALTLGRMYPIALQAGDSGVQSIQGVFVTNGVTAMTAGAFNVLVIRPLWSGRVPLANAGDLHDYLRVGMPQVFDTSCLCLAVSADATSSGTPEVTLTIANG